MKKEEIMAALMLQKSNLHQFALHHGHGYRMVVWVVDTWAGKKTIPKGKKTIRILKDLSEVLGREVVPGITKEAA